MKNILKSLFIEPFIDPIGAIKKNLSFGFHKDKQKQQLVDQMIMKGDDVPSYLSMYFPKPGDSLYNQWEMNNKRFVQLRRDKESKIIDDLIVKYGDEIAKKIINKELWVGMDINHIYEVKGSHKKRVDNVINKVEQTILYYDKHVNRLGNDAYDFEITLESGKVIGWKNRANVATRNL